ncbi:DNA polymerase IV [Paraferrimonas sedimenticola]|uniref:DNA polymerase IV n=1 Tax=Paraferrimonas sedimenticola TaxID=375674 RepID=A0AA37RX92_9GAMM|nr:DNA polymerase IV [Paraferrimonas sedimenticola]GLP96781.1 DNA polymerase IV [Paraferrimonas sedimenticola]
MSNQPFQQRKIIHVDMDCFYAAVEMRDNPELRDKAIAVGGSADRRGVIATCNYKAREFGVRSAMATARALRLCPDLVLVKGRMSVYQEVSRQIRAVFAEYTDKIEPLSLDEAYLDVSECPQFQGSATLIAKDIRRRILEEIGLTASAGIAPVKFLAKVASDLNKPNGQAVIPPAKVAEFVETLPLRKIPGVGKVTAAKLADLGMHTCADAQARSLEELVAHFGKFGGALYERCRGIDKRSVQASRTRKSIGVETTFASDLAGVVDAKQHFDRLLEQLEGRYQRCGNPVIARIGVKLKFEDFQQTTMEQKHAAIDAELLWSLLEGAWERGEGKAVRLIGLQVGLDKPGSAKQLDLGL